MIDSLSRIASSLASFLSARPYVNVDAHIDAISHAMLDALSPYVTNRGVLPETWFKIALATDIQTLWYLRSDLQNLLLGYCGELAAVRQVFEITKMFDGIIPEALSKRVR